MHEGFANVEMPGRFEVLGVQPLAIIDGAHNPPGADVCASVFFDDFQPEGPPDPRDGHAPQPGRDARRAPRRRVRRRPRLHRPVAARGAGPRRARGPPASLGCDEVYVHDTVEAACAAAMKYADADDAILAAGSIYVAGAARPALRKYAN